MNEAFIEGFTIRTYEPDRDATEISRIVADIWQGGNDALMEQQFGVIGEKPWGHWTARSVLNYLTEDQTESFVVESQQGVAGFTSYVIDQARSSGTVGYNGVAREHQGKGLGTAMLAFVMDRIKAAGMVYAEVIVADNDEHAPARHNYEKYGFRDLLGLHLMVQKL
jgi:ribosomal protein S18 acetylase RimI-like enzyme